MNHSTIHREVPRRLALLILSEERGRSPEYPLDPSLISKWCADLGSELGLRYFTEDQFQQLRVVNQHYASGGTRREFLQKLRKIQNGND
ncbi:hypothetical protein [Gloeocapsopsis dulcis]|uniref:Uncharacterized protein n=1 Tax=Gloeocapsopsis dulcis AAB1 = 1H9 TaxID=1433147 RepID=A0A6N8G1V4_9CHRO|nr:hypothetical protein [Gloeocapsopsis dulcis]MUL39380.1 hypothetical protein [Gloeocapsopsis dulcis AAB1 = 1H9]WNN92179.1 hypothetical protein P0S91_26780 [Gloeocapsopsis dulcis]